MDFDSLKQKKVTIDEIARALGVSKTTVSRALSGKGRISQQTRDRVFQYVSVNGRAQNAAVRQGAAEASHNLALVIPSHFVHLDLPFLRKCMGGVCRMADQRGYDVLLCYANSNDTRQLERQLKDHKVDGVILSRTLLGSDPCLDLIRSFGVPFAVLGRLEDKAALQVDNDQVGAAQDMTRLLIQSGSRRIAYIGGSSSYTVNADRLAGYCQALRENGLLVQKELIFTEVESDEQRLDALDVILEQEPDCLLCCDDATSVKVLKDLKARGILVPKQLRLASLYDSEILLTFSPTISAVQFDAASLGTAACRLLLDSMSGKDVQPRQTMGYQVILRESTK